MVSYTETVKKSKIGIYCSGIALWRCDLKLFMYSSFDFFDFISQTFSLFIFYPHGITHTHLKYRISVPSFPNVRARHFPQEQDEEQ